MQPLIVKLSPSDNLLDQQNSAPARNAPQATQGGHPDYHTEPHATAAPAAQQHERWANIPLVMREKRQWCVAGSDKRPYGVGAKGVLYPASVTDPKMWTDFETACAVANRDGLHIGYMLSENDPFTCIDIDVKTEANESDPAKRTTRIQMNRFEKIVREFDSYTELSKSGVGVHVWVKGNIGVGCKREGVEVYSQLRFIICTGNVYIDKPIQDRPELLATLVLEVQNKPNTTQPLPSGPEVKSDDEILQLARNAGNAEKFNAHYAGNFAAIGHDDHSRADMALFQMLAFYTENNGQLERLFLGSALGQRDKAQRKDYIARTIERVRSFEAADFGGGNAEHGRELVEAILKYAIRKDDIPGMLEPGDEDDWIVSISDVLSNPSPEPEFLTKQLMPAGEVTLFAAHGGTGKSLLMLMWAVHAALGRPFLGKRVTQAPVIFYSAEDRGEIVRYRLGKICESLGVDPHEVAKFLTVLDGTGAPVLFEERSSGKSVRSTTTTDVYDRLKRQGDKLGARYFFIDNASDTYAADEIKRAQVQAFLRALRSLGIDRKAGVLLASHVDKQSAKGNGGGQDFSGSTQWHNSVRSRLFMAAAEDGSGLVLTQGKSNHGKKSEEIRLEWTDDGLLEMVTAAEAAATRSVADNFDTDQLLKIIGDLTSKDINVPTAVSGPVTTFKVLARHPDFPHHLTSQRTNALISQAEIMQRIRKEHIYNPVSRKKQWRLILN